MAKINVLDKQLAELIAAGEVVERPASAAKELVENAVDAGATGITVEIQNGGVTFLRVSDNGCGIAREDVPLGISAPRDEQTQLSADDLDRNRDAGVPGRGAGVHLRDGARGAADLHGGRDVAGTRYRDRRRHGIGKSCEDAGLPARRTTDSGARSVLQYARAA